MSGRERRAQRRTKKLLQDRKTADARRKRAGDLLRRTGLEELLRNCRGLVRHGGKNLTIWERLLVAYYPRPTVELGPSGCTDETAKSLLPKLRAALSEASFECPILGPKTLVTDYFAFVKPIADVIGSVPAVDGPDLSSVLAAKELTANLLSNDALAAACHAVCYDLEQVLIRVGRIDSRLFHLSHSVDRSDRGKWTVEFRLHVAAPEVWKFKVDGKTRTAFRCGQPFEAAGIDWVEWPAGTLPGSHAERGHRVYVQDHALKRLYGREGRLGFIHDGEWFVHDCLWASLREPEIHPSARGDGSVFVAYRLGDHKLGYLPALPIGDRVLVKSFLFLTMDETPEGIALRKRLRLQRADKEYLGLDDARTFLFSDLHTDPDLVRVLDECGCGHLLAAVREAVAGFEPIRCAARLRSYLRFPPLN